MKPLRLLATLCLGLATSSVTAQQYQQYPQGGNAPAATGIGGASRLQLGIGPMMANNKEFGDEAGFGLGAEVGLLYDHNPIDMFWGIRGAYIDGVGDSYIDLDILDVSLVGRVLFPLGADAIKLYGEGRLGIGNMAVSGEAEAKGTIGGRRFSFQNDVDEANWTFGWGIGIGVQLDFTRRMGLRIGYDLQSYGDVEAFGFDVKPGFIHGGSAMLVFKF